MRLNDLANNPDAFVSGMKRNMARFQLVFSVLFILGALAAGIFGVIVPALQMRAAQSWTQTPCVIKESVVVRGLGKSSTKHSAKPVYSLTLAYEYQFGGKAYRGTTYSFDATKLEGWRETAAFARSFPVGAATTCWVNPNSPAEAVLKRDAQQPRLLLLVPIGLLAAGIALCLNALKTLRNKD
ncbi:MAG TPA: DUF3592 domain-containing protein [Abditibacteriaceae bacterium]|jgi:hypothetical protein